MRSPQVPQGQLRQIELNFGLQTGTKEYTGNDLLLHLCSHPWITADGGVQNRVLNLVILNMIRPN